MFDLYLYFQHIITTHIGSNIAAAMYSTKDMAAVVASSLVQPFPLNILHTYVHDLLEGIKLKLVRPSAKLFMSVTFLTPITTAPLTFFSYSQRDRKWNFHPMSLK